MAGHINIDHFLTVRELPGVDRTVPLLGQRTELGGTAATLARVAARAGVRTGLVARVGEDFPGEYRRLLTGEGLDLAGVESVPGARSPCCFIIQDELERQVTLIDQGAMGDTRGAGAPDGLVGRADWLHLGTGDPAYLLRLRQAALSQKVHFVVDPAQEIHYRWDSPAFRRLLEGAEILFGNEAEIQRARRLVGASSASELLRHVPMVVVTRASRGARALTRGGIVEVPARRVGRLKQVTGAGDAFRGGFYAAYLRGEPLRASLTAGTHRAASWIRHGGFEPGARKN